MGLFGSKVVDPYNTMGTEPVKGSRVTSRAVTVQGLARQHGITRTAAAEVGNLLSEIEASGGPTSKAADDIRDRIYRIIEDPGNWS